MSTKRRLLFTYPSYHIRPNNTNHFIKRASSCASGSRGSVTIEAALAVPIFFLAVLSLFYMIEVMSIRTSIRSGMQYAAKSAAEEMYIHPLVSTNSLEQDLVRSVGAERLSRSMVVGGAGGISCVESRVSALTGMIDMKVKYEVKLPLPVFAVPPVKMEESLKAKGWTGYVRTGFGNSGEDSETVYITDYGTVYHTDYHCNYLDLSIRSVSRGAVDGLRNAHDARYYACDVCGHGAGGSVYITSYGDRYHTSLSCGGLKRTIYAVPKSEAVGKGACSKCSR